MKNVEVIDTDALIRAFEKRLERLRILYEQYFIGVAKRAPVVELKNVVRLKHELDRTVLRNAAEKFRYNNLRQKFTSQRAYWGRTMRAIEAGTYRRRRDVGRKPKKVIAKGRRRRSTIQDEGMPAAMISESEMADLERPVGPANISRPPSLGIANVVEKRGPSSSSTKSDVKLPLRKPKPASKLDKAASRTGNGEIDAVYRKMQRDYQSCGRQAPTYDKVVSRLQRQIEKARKMHPGKKVRIESFVKDGKPTLAIKLK